MDPWVWAVLLILVGLALAVMEIFIPNGGILAFLSVCSIVGAIIVAFRQGPVAGLAILGMAIVGLPVVVVLALKYWPHTRLGKRVMLGVPRSEDVLPDITEKRGLKDLVGQVGQAKSQMLPSGAVLIDGRTIDAMSEGVPIEPGQRVRVIEVRGNRVVVRPVEDGVPAPEGRPLGETKNWVRPVADASSAKDADPLSRPIESIGPDPFEDSPA